MSEIDVAVIGGGVVGLSCALTLAESGASVCVIERESRPGRGMSTHNSGVIHAGIYYPPGSLKARLCLDGRERLYEFCERHSVAHKRCGKLLVAGHEGEIPELEALRARGVSNGATSLEMVDAGFVRRKEPHVHAVAAVWSPDTGIIEAEALISVLGRLCRANDVAVLVGTAVVDAAVSNRGIEIVTPHERFVAPPVVNCLGPVADDVSAMPEEALSHQAVPRRVRRAGAFQSPVGQRPRVPAPACRWFGARRASESYDVGQRARRANREISGFEGRLRRRAHAARCVSRTDARTAARHHARRSAARRHSIRAKRLAHENSLTS